MAIEQNDDPEQVDTEIPAEGDQDQTSRASHRGRNLAILGLAAAAVVTALVFVIGRDSSGPTSGRSLAPGETLQSYFKDNSITATPVLRGEPGVPSVTLGLPRGWSDAGPDTPAGAYGAAFYDPSVDQEYPTGLVVLLSKLSGNADPAKILEYAPSELQSLPDYKEFSKPKTSTMSGFDAIQLAGLYSKEGEERIIAQKTVVIPAASGFYVLQLNVDGPKSEAEVVQELTAVLDEQAKIAP